MDHSLVQYGVKLYTRNFDSINKKLRSGEQLGMIENLVLKCLYSVAEMREAEEDMIVYRGTEDFNSIDNFSFISMTS